MKQHLTATLRFFVQVYNEYIKPMIGRAMDLALITLRDTLLFEMRRLVETLRAESLLDGSPIVAQA